MSICCNPENELPLKLLVISLIPLEAAALTFKFKELILLFNAGIAFPIVNLEERIFSSILSFSFFMLSAYSYKKDFVSLIPGNPAT